MSAPEEPGEFCHPPIAACITAAARLLLTMLERCVTDSGGSYVFCDTDSLFIAATETGNLVACPVGGITCRTGGKPFRRCPGVAFGRSPTSSLGSTRTSRPLPVSRCLRSRRRTSIPPLVNNGSCTASRSRPSGTPNFVTTPAADPFWSAPRASTSAASTLGHLLDPTDLYRIHAQDGFRDQWWLRLLRHEHHLPSEDPHWLDRPAIGRLNVTSKQEEANFAVHNASQIYELQTRPVNFGIMAFPVHGQPGSGALIAPLDADPRRWNHLDWCRRGEPNAPPMRIRTGDPTFAIPGTVVVQSYRDVFKEYRQHPEAKAAGSDGQPCRPDTRGLLQPLTVTATRIERIGKEANRLANNEDLVDGEDDRPVVYAARRCRGCEQPVQGRRRWCSEACRKRAFRQNR